MKTTWYIIESPKGFAHMRYVSGMETDGFTYSADITKARLYGSVNEALQAVRQRDQALRNVDGGMDPSRWPFVIRPVLVESTVTIIAAEF